MEIKTCEQYVLDQLEQAQDEAEELRSKLMERGERDASKVEQAIRKEGRRKLYRDGTGYRTSVDDGDKKRAGEVCEKCRNEIDYDQVRRRKAKAGEAS